jgi:hypothetical protein
MSGREMTAQAAAAARQEVVRMMLLARLEFDGDPALVTSAPYDVAYDLDGDGEAEIWRSTFGMGQVSGAEEGLETQAYGLTCKLAGLDAAAISLALQCDPQGRPASFWLAFLDADHQIVPAPVLLFRGRMDVMPITGGKSGEITLSVESRLADWDRVRGGRYTDAEQQARCPGDRFFQFCAAACDKEINWGRS